MFVTANIDRFFKAHDDRQGIAVLAFEVGRNCINDIYHRYHTLHPQLLVDGFQDGVKSYEEEADVLEVYAYYQGEKGVSPADEGTILRFIEPKESRKNKVCKLPGIVTLPAKFHPTSSSAYFDHWVSNGEVAKGFTTLYDRMLDTTSCLNISILTISPCFSIQQNRVSGNIRGHAQLYSKGEMQHFYLIFLPSFTVLISNTYPSSGGF